MSDDLTYSHGVSKMDAHTKTCDAKFEDRSWLIFTPPDDVIPSCPKCHDVAVGVTCMLDGDQEHIVHPCHHVLDEDEAAVMLSSSISF